MQYSIPYSNGASSKILSLPARSESHVLPSFPLHDTAGADRVSDRVNEGICVVKCLFNCARIGLLAHSEIVETEVKFRSSIVPSGSFNGKCVLDFLQRSIHMLFTSFIVCLTHGTFRNRIRHHTNLRKHIHDGTLAPRGAKYSTTSRPTEPPPTTTTFLPLQKSSGYSPAFTF